MIAPSKRMYGARSLPSRRADPLLSYRLRQQHQLGLRLLSSPWSRAASLSPCGTSWPQYDLPASAAPRLRPQFTVAAAPTTSLQRCTLPRPSSAPHGWRGGRAPPRPTQTVRCRAADPSSPPAAEGSPSTSSNSSNSGNDPQPQEDPQKPPQTPTPQPPRRNRSGRNGGSGGGGLGPWLRSSLPSWLVAPWALASLRVAFNIGAFFLLLRVWPLGGGGGGPEGAGLEAAARGGKGGGGGGAAVTEVRVPFSVFVQRVKSDEVRGRGVRGGEGRGRGEGQVGRAAKLDNRAGGGGCEAREMSPPCTLLGLFGPT